MSPPITRRSLLTGLVGAALLPGAAAALSASAEEPLAQTERLSQSRREQPLQVLSAGRLEDAARKILPPGAFEYIRGGAGDEWTLGQNEIALRGMPLRPHRLAGFAEADLHIHLLGHALPVPFYVTPMGAQDFAHVEAENASAAGAATVGALYMLSSASNKPLEEVAAASGAGPRWFALYMNQDPSVNRRLLERARTTGYSAVVMTVDSLGPGQSDSYLALGAPKTKSAGQGNYGPRFGGTGTPAQNKKDFSPEDIGFLHEASGLPVLVKGILRPEDAVRCIDAGAAGIIVSNHGGRTLDGAPASSSALASVVKAANGRVPVLFDSGIRRGVDIVRALSLGASAVGIGRPVLYALSLGGSAGVRSVLEFYRNELSAAMLLVGAKRIQDLSPDFLE